MSKGYVYLIVESNEDGKEKFKIGVTKNHPSQRLRKLRTGNSNQLELLKFYESENYKRIEKWFHMKYATLKTISQNEFFDLSDQQVINFLQDCKEIDSTIAMLRRENPFCK